MIRIKRSLSFLQNFLSNLACINIYCQHDELCLSLQYGQIIIREMNSFEHCYGNTFPFSINILFLMNKLYTKWYY